MQILLHLTAGVTAKDTSWTEVQGSEVHSSRCHLNRSPSKFKLFLQHHQLLTRKSFSHYLHTALIVKDNTKGTATLLGPIINPEHSLSSSLPDPKRSGHAPRQVNMLQPPAGQPSPRSCPLPFSSCSCLQIQTRVKEKLPTADPLGWALSVLAPGVHTLQSNKSHKHTIGFIVGPQV